MNEGPPSSIPVWKEVSHISEHSVSESAWSELVLCCSLRVAV